MKAIGVRYRLPVFGLLAEMHNNGDTILRFGETYIHFDKDDYIVNCDKDGADLRSLIDEPTTRRFILRYGRPCGTIWG